MEAVRREMRKLGATDGVTTTEFTLRGTVVGSASRQASVTDFDPQPLPSTNDGTSEAALGRLEQPTDETCASISHVSLNVICYSRGVS